MPRAVWPDIDLDVFFARSSGDITIEGAGSNAVQAAAAPGRLPQPPDRRIVSLSDGTRITFETATQFDPVPAA